MKKLICLFIANSLLLISCGPSEEEQQAHDKAVADSVAKALTGRSITDSNNINKMERVKADSMASKGVIAADAAGLKNIKVESDYDNKLFNKTSDIDGKLFNNSNSTSYKNIQLKVVCKNKKGSVVKSFIHTEHVTLSPNSSSKLRIKFEDAEKTKDASVSVIGAEEIL